MLEEKKLHILNERQKLIIPGDRKETIEYIVDYIIELANTCISKNGRFSIALSGGSTPREVYALLCSSDKIDWTKVWLFWSDERNVKPTDPNSNYNMAMQYFSKTPIPQNQIFRMKAEENLKRNANEYEKTILNTLGDKLFDLVLLGLGDDGHTASLFPQTKALTDYRLVAANYIQQNDTYRMTLTYNCINNSQAICFIVLGKQKKEITMKVLFPSGTQTYPAIKVGTKTHPALWIVDRDGISS